MKNKEGKPGDISETFVLPQLEEVVTWPHRSCWVQNLWNFCSEGVTWPILVPVEWDPKGSIPSWLIRALILIKSCWSSIHSLAFERNAAAVFFPKRFRRGARRFIFQGNTSQKCPPRIYRNSWIYWIVLLLTINCQGRVRMQFPTTTNYAVMFPTLWKSGQHYRVQWLSLTLGIPPAYSWYFRCPVFTNTKY